jgi:hypothetical protein
MNEGLVIPISTPGGEESATALARVADKLEKVGGAADASATKMNTSATASSAALGRIAAAVEQTGKSTEEAGNRAEASGQKWENFWSGGVRGAARFVVVHQALVTVADAVASATRHIGALVDEQERLTAMSNRLGLNFDDAAAAAGRFVDETAAMGVASRFAAADIRLTQQELSDIMRVAAATAETLGTDVAGAAQQLTEALIRGREGGLQRFGGALVEAAGQSHTLDERLTALHTRAGEVSQATDNAATRMERFVDSLEDAQRVATTAFVQEIMRLDDVGRGLRDRTTDAQEFERSLQAVGQTAAAMATRAGAGIAILGGVAGTVIGGLGDMLRVAAAARNGVGAAQAEFARLANSGWSAQSIDLITESVRRLEALDAADEQRTSMDPRDVPAGAARPTDLETRADRTERTRREERGGRGAGGDNSALARQQRDAINAAFGAANDNARVSDLEDLAGLAHDRAAAVHEAELQGLLWSEQTRQDREQMEVDAELRQETRAATARQRAREDAMAAAAAFAGGETAAADTAAAARAAMATEETSATRELARATQDLAQARREENDASISTAERTTHVTEALARQTAALQRQRAAQIASNAEVNKIKTDRTDALAASAKGLGDGLVSAGLAAAFAGENIGAALQKQLAASLQALAIESAQKALFALAQGFYFLAIPGGQASAAASFTSAAIFGAVAVGAGAVSAAIAPSAAPAAAGGGAGAGRAGDVTPSGAGGMGGGASAGPIVNNYYAPIVGGRQSTDAETGVRIDRYNDAARARLRRAA